VAEKRLDIILNAKDVGVAKAFTQIGNQAVSIQKQVNAAAVQFTRAANGDAMMTGGAAVSFGRRGGLNVGAGNALGGIRSVEAEAKASAERLEQQSRDRRARQLREERRASRERAEMDAYFASGQFVGSGSQITTASGRTARGGANASGGFFDKKGMDALGFGAKAFVAGVVFRDLEKLATKLSEVRAEIERGEKSWGDFVEELGRGIPVIGDAWAAGRAIRNLAMENRAGSDEYRAKQYQREQAGFDASRQTLAEARTQSASFLGGLTRDLRNRELAGDPVAQKQEQIRLAQEEFAAVKQATLEQIKGNATEYATMKANFDAAERRMAIVHANELGKIQQDALDERLNRERAAREKYNEMLRESGEKVRDDTRNEFRERLRDRGQFLDAEVDEIAESTQKRIEAIRKEYADLRAAAVAAGRGTQGLDIEESERIARANDAGTRARNRAIANEQAAAFDAMGQAMFEALSGRGGGIITANSRTASLQSERFASGDGDLIATRTYEIQKKTADNTKVTAEAAKKTAELMNRFVNDSLNGNVFVWGGASNN
jgi:hypothetical protein